MKTQFSKFFFKTQFVYMGTETMFML